MSARFTWLGHSSFRVDTPGGKVILIDPWVTNNPVCPADDKLFDRLDIMLCTHGHYDHVQDAVEVSKRYHPKIVGIFELCTWLENQGVDNLMPMNIGGTIVIDGISITMVHAEHSSGYVEDDGRIIYLGQAAGFVIKLEDNNIFYHAGDTGVFGDMKLIAEMYQPSLAMIPIGDRYVMSPREAVYACKLIGCSDIIPMHHGTFEGLTGTVDEFRMLARNMVGMNIVDIEPGQVFVLSGAEQGLG